MSQINRINGRTSSVLAIALLGALGLGAKGCDRAVVGDDGQCKDCTAGEAGASTGGTENAGTGGSPAMGGMPGHAGSTTAGRAGSGGSGSAGKGGGTAGRAGSGGGSATCGGLIGADCPRGEFCDFPPDAICGAADATGVCRAMPEACTEQYDPVCGCDDVTYGNACMAAMSGMSVASSGECESAGTVCGGFRGETCADDEFCDFPPDAICGWADATGVCEPIPEACDAILLPVCGCDGMTYSSACAANMAGVSVETEGECDEPVGGTCGGLLGARCADGMFCDFAPDAMCGAADQTGTCEPIPEACTTDDTPVCGCDDMTYSNACEAHRAEVAVAADGACPTDPGFCGGIAGFGCPEGQFCYFALETMCGSGDQAGTCVEIEADGACTQEFDPVCGCDGVTYSNECAALRAGQSVQSLGECPRE